MKKSKDRFCCDRFSMSVKEKAFFRSEDDNDETEWFIAEWLHIYYCPFCGAFVKGKGWGEFHKDKSLKKE
jgi:hypothetical protein